MVGGRSLAAPTGYRVTAKVQRRKLEALNGPFVKKHKCTKDMDKGHRESVNKGNDILRRYRKRWRYTSTHS